MGPIIFWLLATTGATTFATLVVFERFLPWEIIKWTARKLTPVFNYVHSTVSCGLAFLTKSKHKREPIVSLIISSIEDHPDDWTEGIQRAYPYLYNKSINAIVRENGDLYLDEVFIDDISSYQRQCLMEALITFHTSKRNREHERAIVDVAERAFHYYSKKPPVRKQQAGEF